MNVSKDNYNMFFQRSSEGNKPTTKLHAGIFEVETTS